MEFIDRYTYRHKQGIYCIECIPTGEKYIGKTEDMFLHRYHSHVAALKKNKHSRKIQDRWNEYGSGKFIFYIMHTYESGDNLGELEKYYIKKLDTINNGFNIQGGGHGGLLSEETKAKMRKSSRHTKLTPERIKAMAEARKGSFTEESRQKMREAKLYGKGPQSVLNTALVIKIKVMLMSGMNIGEVSKVLGIAYHNVRTVYRGDSWEYIEVPGFDEYIESNKVANVLSDEEVLEIREFLSQGLSASKIAKLTGHKENVIYGIKQGRTYKDVI